MERYQALLRLASETLTRNERWKLNEALRDAQGYDYIDSILEDMSFSRGPRIGKDSFYLRRDGEPVGNAMLQGDYRGMQVVPMEWKDTSEMEFGKIPWDSYYSSAHLYDEWEREQEAKED